MAAQGSGCRVPGDRAVSCESERAGGTQGFGGVGVHAVCQDRWISGPDCQLDNTPWMAAALPDCRCGIWL